MSERLVFARAASGLRRELTAQDVFLWSMAAPAGTGFQLMFVTDAWLYPGGLMPIAVLVAFAMLLPMVITLALSTATLPRAGGMYVPISRVISPAVGFFATWTHMIPRGMAIGVTQGSFCIFAGGAMAALGTIMKDPSLVSAGTWLTSFQGIIIGGFIIIVGQLALVLFGMKWSKLFMRIFTWMPIITAVFVVVYFYAIGPAGFPEAFNRSWGAGAYGKIISAAKEKGYTWPTGFDFGQTIGALAPCFFAYGNWEAVTFAAGEVKTPARSILRGVIVGSIGTLALYYLYPASVYYAAGPEFIASHGFLVARQSATLATIIPPLRTSIPYYIVSALPHPIGIMLAIGMACWVINSAIPNFVLTSRLLFAEAMDRALPAKLADVNVRGSPTYASYAALLYALVGLYAIAGPTEHYRILTGYWPFAAYNFFWLFGMSMILLPYVRPAIFERVVGKKYVGALPLISLMGVLTFTIGFWIVGYGMMRLSMETLLLTAIYEGFGFLIYFLTTEKNRRAGIDVSKIYAEVPPE